MAVMLYKAGGDTHLPQHGGYFSINVVDESDVSDALNDGWHATTQDALSPVETKPKRARKAAD